MEGGKGISKENQSEIKRTFECLDKNKDGKLSASEFVRGSKIMHVTMTEEEAKAMIKEVDANGSGYIEYDEFEQLMKVQLEKYDKKKAMCMKNFKKFDKDNSGAIDFNELKMVLKKSDWTMSETEIQEHFDKADKNGDGKITFSEFVKYFCEI